MRWLVKSIQKWWRIDRRVYINCKDKFGNYKYKWEPSEYKYKTRGNNETKPGNSAKNCNKKYKKSEAAKASSLSIIIIQAGMRDKTKTNSNVSDINNELNTSKLSGTTMKSTRNY